jgi:hypothetical protein
MKTKTSELSGAALDWAVCTCEGESPSRYTQYSTDWAQGGPIIERQRIELEWSGSEWWARIKADEDFSGPAPLVAAMRCYVASVLGDEVDAPYELMEI